MRALLGVHVYGEAQIDTRRVSPVLGSRRSRKHRVMVAGLVGVVAVLAAYAAYDVVAGRRAVEVEQQVAVLHDLLEQGSFEAAAELHMLLRTTTGPREQEVLRNPASIPTLEMADALLYRLWDADSDRRRRLDARVRLPAWIDALLLPRRARSSVLAYSHRESSGGIEGPEPWVSFLRGTAFAAVKDRIRADGAFSAALDIAPSNLPVLAELACDYADPDRSAIARLAEQVRDIAPESPWVAVVRSRATLLATEDEVVPPMENTPAVLRAWIWLDRAIERSFALVGVHEDAPCAKCHTKKLRSGRTKFLGLDPSCLGGGGFCCASTGGKPGTASVLGAEAANLPGVPGDVAGFCETSSHAVAGSGRLPWNISHVV